MRELKGGAKRLTKEQIALANSVYNAQKDIMEKAEVLDLEKLLS